MPRALREAPERGIELAVRCRVQPEACPQTGSGAAPAARTRLRAAAPTEHTALLDWLDAGLRGGIRGRLAAEQPIALGTGDASRRHVLATRGTRLLSHAMGRVAHVRAAGCSAPLGMIGLVYTEPAARREGLASACIQACCEELAASGADLVALWSDRHAFYARLGFAPAGQEVLVRLDAEVCRRARGTLAAAPLPAEPARDADWPQLESLYANRPCSVVRAPGDLEQLAAAPGCRLVVARDAGRAVAYAALGRGDDFGGVVHEWAGRPDGVLSCLEGLLADQAELLWLNGPLLEAPGLQLRRAGARAHVGCFALVRVIDAPRLWRRLASHHPGLGRLSAGGSGGCLHLAGPAGEVELDAPQTLALLLGPRLPLAVDAILDGPSRRALHRALPWPLFVWGFDSL